MKQSISVVIPNYNGKILLESNLPCVYQALKASGIDDFEIIISDDASTDDSIAFIKGTYSNIILIENKWNKGFAGNVNSGISIATKDLVFILNSDVVLTDHYFTPLLSYFEFPDTFGVMGKIIGISSDKIQDGAKYPSYQYGSIGSSINYTSRTQNSLFSIFLSGANALVDRRKVQELGGFNELFNPYYSEDFELGLRAWRLGYKCYYEHSAICRHPNSATIKKEPSNKVKIIAKRNIMYVHYIHLQGHELAFYLVVLTIKTFFRTLFFDFNYLKSFWLFVLSIDKCMDAKREFLELQRIKNCHLTLRNVISIVHRRIGNDQINKF